MASFYTVSGVSLASQGVSPAEYDLYKASYPTLVLGAVAANVTTTNASVSFILKDGAGSTVSYIGKNLTVPLSSSLDVVSNKVVLLSGYSISCTQSVASGIDVTASFLEIRP